MTRKNPETFLRNWPQRMNQSWTILIILGTRRISQRDLNPFDTKLPPQNPPARLITQDIVHAASRSLHDGETGVTLIILRLAPQSVSTSSESL